MTIQGFLFCFVLFYFLRLKLVLDGIYTYLKVFMCREIKETSLMLNPPLKDPVFLQMHISEIGSERSFICIDSIKLSYIFLALTENGQ